MKFRGKMNVAYVRQFHNVLTTMAKLSKSCVLRIDQENLYFITNEPGVVSGFSAWCQMESRSFFEEYVLEGVTEESPEIYLELQPVLMAQSLALLKTAKDSIEMVKMKLTRKRQQACLSFSIEMPSNRQCVHDIPVSPIPRRDWPEYAKPDYEKTVWNSVSLIFPDVKKLKHVVERYKNLGAYVNFEADQKGQFKMSLLSDRVTLSTLFKDLQVMKNPLTIRTDVEPVTLNIELKKLTALLGAETIGAKGCTAHFVREKILHISLVRENVTLEYYLPGILTGLSGDYRMSETNEQIQFVTTQQQRKSDC